ncbi:MAG TPA: hypothetical protein VFT45_21745 [Longimicrobium sp.]|nr:hypothetical protein [Longimicrobium sp.]
MLATLMVFVLTPITLPAQAVGRMRDHELAASGAPILYDAIAAIHPDWLPPGGANRVAVFVNGVYRGDAGELRNIRTDSIGSVRLETPGYAAQYLRRYPAGSFDRVILVVTRGSAPASRGRFTVAFHGGSSVASMASAAHRELRAAGYGAQYEIFGQPPQVRTFKEKDAKVPFTTGASVNYRITDRWGVALVGVRTHTGWAGGFNEDANTVVSTRTTSSEAAVLATADRGVLRVGVGPVYQRAEWNWATTWCGCKDLRTETSSSLGAAAEVVARVPLGRFPVNPSLSFLGRYYAAREVTFLAPDENVEVGGFMLTMGMGVSVHF